MYLYRSTNLVLLVHRIFALDTLKVRTPEIVLSTDILADRVVAGKVWRDLIKKICPPIDPDRMALLLTAPRRTIARVRNFRIRLATNWKSAGIVILSFTSMFPVES